MVIILTTSSNPDDQEKAKQYKEAVEAYVGIIDNYPDSIEMPIAKKYKAQIEELAGE